jgi:DNA-binding CsgD family transcriptional regulator
MTVLRGVGIESESVLAFAGLHQLLRPTFNRIDNLPNPQAAALRSAFALSTEPVGARFRVAVGVLGLLCEVAEERPLLCVIDDAQWFDQASNEALLFAARRLEAEPVAILWAARDEVTGGFAAPRLPDLQLSRLSEADARSLATARVAGDAARATIEWLVENAQGNPLALIELAASNHASGAVPPTTSVEEAYLRRIRRLPPGVRQLLVVAAAEETGDRSVIARAAAEAGLDPDDLAVAEADGLVDVGPEVVEFHHPLVRSAAYRGAGFAERERAHRVLAAVLDDPADADRRAWHRAAATVGADEQVAADLEASAGRAQQRGGFGVAASALVRAADLSEDDGARGRRLLLAAKAAHQAGQYEQTIALTERAGALDPDPLARADLAIVRGSAEIWLGRPAETSDMLRTAAAAVAPHDVPRALQLGIAAAEAAALAGDASRLSQASHVTASLRVDPDDEDQVGLSLVPQAGAHLYAGDVGASAPMFRRAAGLSEGTAPASVPPLDGPALVWRAIASLFAGDYDRARDLYGAAASGARNVGAVGVLWYVLTGQALCHLYFASVREAAEAAHEAVRLAADLSTEENSVHAISVLGWAAAIQGDQDQLRRYSAMMAVDAARGLALPPATIAWGRAELALAQGRWSDALSDLRDVGAFRPGFGHPLLAAATAPALVEAAVRSGRPDLATDPLDRLTAWVEHTRPQHREALLERALALQAGSPDDAAAHYQRALQLAEHGGGLFNRARTQLLYGELLRRERKRSDARTQLRAALTGFEQLGAAPWVERASVELRATGETTRRGDPGALTQLTPQEMQIARLVGGGGSNKDIAAQLFLSPRTVEYHLSKVYMKLGIGSRAELIRNPVGVDLVSV